MRLFLPHKTLEEWVAEDKVDLQGDKLAVKETSTTYPVTNAVHFIKLVSGEDVPALVGRVKIDSQIHALGAEHMADSVVLGDAAYEVSPGFVVEVPNPVQPKADPKKKGGSPEADLLAAFILDKL